MLVRGLGQWQLGWEMQIDLRDLEGSWFRTWWLTGCVWESGVVRGVDGREGGEIKVKVNFLISGLSS